MARIIVNEGEGPRSVALSADRTVVGSNPECDVVLTHDSALGARFAIVRDGDGWRVEVVKGAVLLNETAVAGGPLAHNDTLRVGESMVLFKDKAERAAGHTPDVGRAPAATGARLEDLPPIEELEELDELEALEAPDEAPASAEPTALAEVEEPAQPAPAEPELAEALDELEELETLDELDELEELEELEEPAATDAAETAPVLPASVAPDVEPARPPVTAADVSLESLARHASDDASEAEPVEEALVGLGAFEATAEQGADESEADEADEAEEAEEPAPEPVLATATTVVRAPTAAPRRATGPIRFRRPLPPGCKAPTHLPPPHPGRPPR